MAGDGLPGALAEAANYGNAKGTGYPGGALGVAGDSLPGALAEAANYGNAKVMQRVPDTPVAPWGWPEIACQGPWLKQRITVMQRVSGTPVTPWGRPWRP